MTRISTETAKRAAIYRKAAMLGENGAGDGSCAWIGWAKRGMTSGMINDAGWMEDRDVKGYQTLFLPVFAFHSGYWGENWSDVEYPCKRDVCEEVRPCRVLALCFMAAMVEAGDA